MSESIERFRVEVPDAVLRDEYVSDNEKGIEYRGRTWYPLSSIPGYEAVFNFAEQSVDLKFKATEFAATRLGGYEKLRAPPTTYSARMPTRMNADPKSR